MRRRRFTEREVISTLLAQGAKIDCPRCGQPLLPSQVIEREHFHELALGGSDDVRNCFYSHSECHHLVTNGTKWTTAGSSMHKIAKAKRMDKKRRGEATAKRRLRPLPDRLLRAAKCPTHPEYLAKRRPRAYCETCWDIWEGKNR